MLPDLRRGYVLITPLEVENIVSQNAFNAPHLPDIIAQPSLPLMCPEHSH